MKDEILKVAQEVLTEDEVSEIIKERFKKAITDACDSAFRWGDLSDAIEKKIKDTMTPYIEEYDFSEYLPKLDTVLTEILNSDNCMADKKILENFKLLTTDPDVKEITVTDLFYKWVEYCNKNIDTDGLEVEYGDGVSYESVDCNMDVEMEEKREWSHFQFGTITFENEHDEKLNVQIRVNRYDGDINVKDNEYEMSAAKDLMLSSLRTVDEFKLYLMKLDRAGTKIIVDSEYEADDIVPEKEPEPSFN